MTPDARNSCAAFLLLTLVTVPIMASAADEACAGVTQKCTKDKTYDKTINGSVYSCYDCKQALCKDGGNGGISGTATSSVCTEKATTFQPISLDRQSRGGETLAPKTRTSSRPGGKVDPRTRSLDEADPLAVSPGSPLVAVPLTKAECRKLGGRVTSISVCKTAGNAVCRTTDQSGEVHLVCIGEVVKTDEATGESPIVSPNNRTDRPTTGGNLVVAPLTSQECAGLGGTENFSFKCAASLQKACTTVDEHGVVRIACIDKVAD